MNTTRLLMAAVAVKRTRPCQICAAVHAMSHDMTGHHQGECHFSPRFCTEKADAITQLYSTAEFVCGSVEKVGSAKRQQPARHISGRSHLESRSSILPTANTKAAYSDCQPKSDLQPIWIQTRRLEQSQTSKSDFDENCLKTTIKRLLMK